MRAWQRIGAAIGGVLLIAMAAAALDPTSQLLPSRAQRLAHAAPLEQESWTIRSFQARIAIERDGALRIDEYVQVDFGTTRRRGIFREIPVVLEYDDAHNRVYPLRVETVRDAAGRAWPYAIESVGANTRIRIGDPEREVTGRQDYALIYRVEGALNAFPDHDELFWNVTGAQWPVAIQQASAEVVLPADGITQIACYQGPSGSREPCRSTRTPRLATFQATRPLGLDNQLTIVVGFARGIVAEPRPRLERKLSPTGLFTSAPVPMVLAGTALTTILAVWWIGSTWWRHGRDRRYTSIHYLTDDPRQETRPLGAADQIVIEFEPPGGLRPAQAGVLLDERADPLDATATIVDLAVRGYLTIQQIKSTTLGIFTREDWLLTRRAGDPQELLPFEKALVDGLFQSGSPVKLSDLKTRMAKHLDRAQDALYLEVGRRGWFDGNPEAARLRWRLTGVGVIILGSALTGVIGYYLGAGLIGLPIALAGVAMTLLAPAMSRRTAKGSELLRRLLGFRQYLATAETERHKYNEEREIFAEYLPYAIVFRCVDKWARAFKDLDAREAVGSWYAGGDAFSSTDLSRDLEGLASTVSSTIASTPGGSGGSGFGGGGGAGGGGGGGGGGAW